MSEDETQVQYPPPNAPPESQSPPPPQAAPPPPQQAAPPPPQTQPQAAPPPPPQYAPPPQAPPPQPGFGAPQPSLVDRAKAGDSEALATMFAQFLPRGEQVLEAHYLGVLGLWGIGTHSFGAVTARRFATLRISLMGGVSYQDGSLEYVNSAAVFQPSKVKLYITVGVISFFLALFGIATLAGGSPLGILFLLLAAGHFPVTVPFYYRRNKSGIVLWVREGLSLYAFIDRSRIRVANQLYRRCIDAREERLRTLGHP